MTTRLIANIDIKNEYVIKGIQLEGLRKIGSPIDIIKKFYKENIHEIIIHDTVASYYNRNNLGELLKECFKEIFIPVTIGGGIRTLKDIKNSLNNGADKIMINSKAIKSPEFLRNACEEYGSSTIISYVEVKKHNGEYYAYFNSGRERSEYQLDKWFDIIQNSGCGEILIKSVDFDGTMKGIDEELINFCLPICDKPLIYAGGCSSEKEILYFEKKYKTISLSFASLFYSKNFKLSKKVKSFK